MSYKKRFKPGRKREKWTDILPRYLTFISHMRPILRETRRIIIDLDADLLLDIEILDKIRQEEEKRNIRKVRALSEFSAMYRSNVYEIIKDFIIKYREEIPIIDIKDYIVEFIHESVDALNVLQHITNPDEFKLESTYLFQLVKFIEDKLFPRGSNLKIIYKKLLEHSPEFYECQRHLLQSHTYYREKLERPDNFEIPGISPKVYQIINNITSLYNLDPNFGVFPEKNNYEIPMILKNDVFLPYIDAIANAEEEAIEKLAERFGLRIIDEIFLAPQKDFVEILLENNYLRENKQSDGMIRLLPQFSNETLIIFYLTLASQRRGFLSKELINWVSMNFAFIIYMGILKWKLSDENIFYAIFKDLQTNEKILPYLMKLICFPNYLALDKMKIRDSVQYRKEIFNFIGSQIDNIKDFIIEISIFCKKFETRNE
ncbi:MAG: hypothetical protein Lokiarch_34360 [Candidatus Lokiarchaeum sp. GC14_75]|nr:MAG: hypothetical protein Lokiarch_34360 [Candidatus Lokiarchaeum sp. GC14_75]HEC39103.1 hypothetical protein [bacterium]